MPKSTPWQHMRTPIIIIIIIILFYFIIIIFSNLKSTQTIYLFIF